MQACSSFMPFGCILLVCAIILRDFILVAFLAPLICRCLVAYYGFFALDFHSYLCLYVGFTPSSRVARVAHVFAGFSHIFKPKHARDGGS